jgi:group I intron endonuclease
MEQIGYIYKLTAPNGKVYIGQTIHLEKRMWSHSYARRKCKLSSAIKTYGWESFTQEIICSGPFTQEGLNQLEMHYIRLYNSLHNGLNLTEGGGGRRGWIPSVETKAKISAAKKGVYPSEEHRAKLSVAQMGKKQSPETITKRVAALIRPVSQYSEDGIWIRDWPSRGEAAEALGIPTTLITRCITGWQKTTGGYVWKYKS